MAISLLRSEGLTGTQRKLFLAVFLTIGSGRAVHAENEVGEGRTWKTVAELTAEERAAIDVSASTPRHPEFPYLPAELFPFSAPYTAEEMGLRSMEFGYWRRWTSSTVQVYGSVDAHGYKGSVHVRAEIHAKAASINKGINSATSDLQRFVHCVTSCTLLSPTMDHRTENTKPGKPGSQGASVPFVA